MGDCIFYAPKDCHKSFRCRFNCWLGVFRLKRGYLVQDYTNPVFFIFFGWVHETLYKTQSRLLLSLKSPSLSFFQLGWKSKTSKCRDSFFDSIKITSLWIRKFVIYFHLLTINCKRYAKNLTSNFKLFLLSFFSEFRTLFAGCVKRRCVCQRWKLRWGTVS